jgi:hypothetical protein
MGDGKSAVVTSSGRGVVGSSSTPRVTARRTNRYASSRSSQSVRAPIILELGSTVIRVGYADSFQPRHLIPVPTSDAASSAQGIVNQTESQWYATLTPWIEAVYDRLLCNPNSRKVIVLHPQFVVATAWKAALEQILWNKGVPEITFVSALEILPVAQGWKRALIVHVSRDEAVCICHSDGHLLPFTFQSVPECGYQHLLEDSHQLQREWTAKMDFCLLDELHNPNSFVTALIKCLEACPRDIRYDVIHNIVFCGDGLMVIPDLGRRVAQRLEQILEGTQPTLEAKVSEDDDYSARQEVPMAAVPVAVKSFQSLASRLRMVSCEPYRPDLIAWAGSSLWAATWNRYDNEESRIDWKLSPQE